jgi:hypothetical protein
MMSMSCQKNVKLLEAVFASISEEFLRSDLILPFFIPFLQTGLFPHSFVDSDGTFVIVPHAFCGILPIVKNPTVNR